MAIELVLPRLGWTMEEGVFVEWLKRDGDTVQPGDLIYTIESDKTTVEVENFDAGILRIPPDAPAPGSRIAVGTRLAYVVQRGETPPFEAEPVKAAEPITQQTASKTATHTMTESVNRRNSAAQAVHASPRARRAAKQLGVDWSALAGSGTSGRVLERDVRAAAKVKQQAGKLNISPIAQRVAEELGVDVAALLASMPDKSKRIERGDVERFAAAQQMPSVPTTHAPAQPIAAPAAPARREKISRMRRVIADRMSETARTVVPVTLTTQADATELVRLRKSLKAELGDAAPAYNDMLAKIAAKALTEHPHMNARLEGDEIVTEAGVHIGIAVDTERGLLVAVVRDAQGQSLRQFADASREVIARVQAGAASPDDLRGSTFTITNLGVYEIDVFTPIINAPECAILGVGRIAQQPVMVKKKVRARHMMALSLTFDHRLVDGAPAARFLQRIKHLIEQPYLWLVD
jgi:pyruvate dehydrogenase E2 component (dihydrolipoamide acetyltransferase)